MEQQEEQQRRWKRGEVGPDGRIFRNYENSKERWFTSKEAYERQTTLNNKYYRDNLKARRQASLERKRQLKDLDFILVKRKKMLYGAKKRAVDKGLDFNLTLDDIIIPEICPILNIPFNIYSGDKYANFASPSLDRIDTSKGYIKGNVAVITCKANTMKNSSSIEEVRSILAYLETNLPQEQSPS